MTSRKAVVVASKREPTVIQGRLTFSRIPQAAGQYPADVALKTRRHHNVEQIDESLC
jgi:hypothetical protein